MVGMASVESGASGELILKVLLEYFIDSRRSPKKRIVVHRQYYIYYQLKLKLNSHEGPYK